MELEATNSTSDWQPWRRHAKKRRKRNQPMGEQEANEHNCTQLESSLGNALRGQSVSLSQTDDLEPVEFYDLMKRPRISGRLFLFAGLCWAFFLSCNNLAQNKVYCQRLGEPPPPPIRFSSQLQGDNTDPNRQGSAFSQLVNILQNYASQAQQQQQQQQQQGYLPARAPGPQQQQPQPQPQQPYLPTPSSSFGPLNRRISSPQQVQQPQLGFQVSSSPATPYLTLNRLAGMQPMNGMSRPVGPLQPFSTQTMNSIPLPRGLPVPQQPQPQQSQVNQRAVFPALLPSVQRPIVGQAQLGPRGTAATPVQVRPLIAGFAPSGPPPSPNAANQALTVVQSPPASLFLQAQPSVEPSEPSSQVSGSTTSSPISSTLSQQQTSDSSGSSFSMSTSSPEVPKLNSTESSVSSEQLVTESSSARNSSEPVSIWSPIAEPSQVTANRSLDSARSTTLRPPTLAPSPDIVTVPPGYNPDQPRPAPSQSYDIPVSALIGAAQTPNLSTNSSLINQQVNLAVSAINAAPTAVTTIIWSPTSAPMSSSSSLTLSSLSVAPSLSMTPPEHTEVATSAEPGVVYGRTSAGDSKPGPPVTEQQSGKPFIQPAPMDSQVRPFAAMNGRGSSGLSARPGNQQQQQQHRVPGLHVGTGFQIAAGVGNQTSIPSGDIQDYVAAQPPLLLPAASGPSQPEREPIETSNFDLGEPMRTNSSSPPIVLASPTPGQTGATSSSGNLTPRIRRPTFKPKPLVPPIRIDSCIVNDDSSCEQSHNERCVTEYGISSCHCKPGYARLSQLRGYCSPVSLLQLSMRIEKLADDRRLVYNQTLNNSSSEEYQLLEFEAVQALAGAFQLGSLNKQFLGARVNKFFERRGRVWANLSISLEANNLTRSLDRVQSVAGQELTRAISLASNQKKPLGDSMIVLDPTNKETLSKLSDMNECASRELNDCSEFASCTNEFGSFQCQCLPGYEDKQAAKPQTELSADELQTIASKQGRVCLGCPASFCSGRGTCQIGQDGERRCKCRPNFVGARCDIDIEVLAVALGGSIIGIVILLSTFWCLFIFNRRWKREQQKLDAMSATSGLTYNYVNSNSTNSLMTPARVLQATTSGLHRAGGHQVAAVVANYQQQHRMGRAHQTQFAQDQQAIIGSGSSSASSLCQQQQSYGLSVQHQNQQYPEEAGLLIAPASTGSSEQTSPTSNSYRGILAPNAYTLSGHHHHHSTNYHQQHYHQLQLGPKPNGPHLAQLSQFNPGADYRSLAPANQASNAAYDGRWRTLQQEQQANKQSGLVGYYLSSDMLMGQQPQLYAAPQRELCIDTDNQKSRRQGRGAFGHTLRARQQASINPGAHFQGHLDYEH